MPTAPAARLLRVFSDDPALWTAAGIALVLIGILLLRGSVRAIRRWRRRRADTITMTIAQVRRTDDYLAATAGERAALDRINPAAQLVRETDFDTHVAAVAREIVGEDRCAKWPYRHINLEEAVEDLRERCRSIRLRDATWWFRV
jgi:hypothetical protein